MKCLTQPTLSTRPLVQTKMIFVSFASLFALCCATVGGFAALPTSSPQDEGQKWAVLVAGSNGYFNYRHQADVCHAYKDLVSHGIPESNIIVMMYDDIAFNSFNPTKGVVINQPNGSDVYRGVPKHYTQEDVSPANFIKVLLGDPELEKKGRKVLKSGPKDHVFVYFADHGGSLILSFPNDVLTATQLISTLKKMHKRGKFARLVFYVEACESGSMFDGLLPPNLSIYAATAASPNESSYACFYDSVRQTYLGDQFSVNWLIDSDVGKVFGNETLQQQFNRVKAETDLSNANQYGDMSLVSLPISQFLGTRNPTPRPNPFKKCDDPFASSAVPVEIMRRRAEVAAGAERVRLEGELKEILARREYMDSTVRKIIEQLCAKGHCAFSESLMTGRATPITRHHCAEKLIKTFHKHCFNMAHHTYAPRHARTLVNIAEALDGPDVLAKCKAVKMDLKRACFEHADRNIVSPIV